MVTRHRSRRSRFSSGIRLFSTHALVLSAALLAACGGDDGSPGTPAPGPDGPSSRFANQCATNNVHAVGTDGGFTDPDYRPGSLDLEKAWVRSYMQESYLWYTQMPAVDPAGAEFTLPDAYQSVDNWFEALKTKATTPSGKLVDEFSFTAPTRLWNARIEQNESVDYGAQFITVSRKVPRVVRVAFVNPKTAAEAAGMKRGDTVRSVTIDGSTVAIDTTDSAGIDLLNKALNPSVPNQTVTFALTDAAGTAKSATVTSSSNAVPSVQKVSTANGGKIGYMQFNSFTTASEGELVDAVRGLQRAGVQDLIIDMRYNGGGYLYVASQLAYMVAGAARTDGKAFETTVYNDRIDPTKSASDKVTPFIPVSSGRTGTNTIRNAALPTLNLSRLYVLTSHATCSASEALINGLRGIDLPVTLIGATTCGKPYGFVAQDNCGISYFPIQQKGVNAKGFGDYADGFAPNVTLADDLDHELGAPEERLLNQALACAMGDAACVAAGPVSDGGMSGLMAGKAARRAEADFPFIDLPPWKSSKIYR